MTYSIPDHCRYVQRACQINRLIFEDFDDGNGYLYRVSDGQSQIFLNSRLGIYPLNSASAFALARDKGFTNRVLDEAKIANLGGRCFFLTDEHSKLRARGYEIADARMFIDDLGFPCFCKPLTGSRGDFAEIVRSSPSFERYIDRVKKKHDSIIIQKVYVGTEYRVFVLDGQVKFLLKKHRPKIVGDGKKSVYELLEISNEDRQGTGVSRTEVLEGIYDGNGVQIEPSRVPKLNECIELSGRQNLSAGGTLGELLLEPAPELESLALLATEALGLRIAGVDILVEQDTLTARVIEVNASPAIHSLEQLGRWDLIEDIWSQILIKALGSL